MSESRIVIGIDGSESGWQALTWAADEAARTGRPLVVAHAGDTAEPYEPNVAEFGPSLVRDAVARLADDYPLVPVSTVLREGDPAELLLDLAGAADLLVVGRGRRGLPLMRIGSVADQVLAHAECPTAVVGRTDQNHSNTVVAGVSDSPGGMAALRFAFAEAERRDAQVIAVRSWSSRDWRLVAAALPSTTPDMWERAEREVLDECLRQVTPGYPDVPVRTVVSGTPVELALEQEAGDAAMLVLGCRRSDDTHLPRLGLVTYWAVHHAQCPVVVVGHPSTTNATRPAAAVPAVSAAKG